MTLMLQQQPGQVLREKSIIWSIPVESPEYAKRMDEEDPLGHFRDQFCFPRKADLPYVDKSRIVDEDEQCLYLCGQSLGLKPKATNNYVTEVLDSWGSKGVHCHFNGYLPAALSDIPPKLPMSRLVGAKETEVAIMNGLTVNLHVLMATFYKPTSRRHKIIIEKHAFSSDMYVVKSQITLHGYSLDTSLVTLKPRIGEYLIRDEDVVKVIQEEGDSVAVILIPGIQYYSGQLFNVPKITAAAHDKGIIVGVDLAHAAGNVPIYLSDWEVDFAAWCTYKYMNAGAGCIGAIFVNEKWTQKGGNSQFPMLKGWWGNNIKTKFLMKDDFDGSEGADMFKLSNPPAVLCSMLMASLEIFNQTSMEDIYKKQFLLTGYLEYLLKCYFGKSQKISRLGYRGNHSMPSMEIITPPEPSQRGSQLSLIFSVPLASVQEELQKRGIVCDIRMPNVMRVAPAPLYNSFIDVFKFVNALKEVCQQLEGKFLDKMEEDVTQVSSSGSSGRGNATSSSPVAISSDSEPDSLVGTNTL